MRTVPGISTLAATCPSHCRRPAHASGGPRYAGRSRPPRVARVPSLCSIGTIPAPRPARSRCPWPPSTHARPHPVLMWSAPVLVPPAPRHQTPARRCQDPARGRIASRKETPATSSYHDRKSLRSETSLVEGPPRTHSAACTEVRIDLRSMVAESKCHLPQARCIGHPAVAHAHAYCFRRTAVSPYPHTATCHRPTVVPPQCLITRHHRRGQTRRRRQVR